MDTILDSNIFLSDLNFQGTHFAELFAYLKRTGDMLVLPTMVMQEASARYRERLSNTLNKAKSAWVSLGGIRVSTHPAFPHIDLDKEIDGYRNRLIRAAPGARVLQYSDVSGIDANEIARRGSQRIRPASPNGEELRDVLLWLLVFQYARQTKREVALISGDKVFREPDAQEPKLHPDLAAEIAESKLPIHFFADIGLFLTSQSLSHEKVDAAWADKYLQSEDFEHRIVMEIYKGRTKYGVPELVAMDRPEFEEGTVYRISPESDYAELKYKGKTRLTFDQAKGGYLSDFAKNLSDLIRLWGGESREAHPDVIDVRPGLVTLYELKTPKVTRATQSSKIEKGFNFEAFLSARVEKEKLVAWQVDEIRLTEAGDMPDSLTLRP